MSMEKYRDRTIKHSLMWVNGVVEHNKIDDECVADFSCCVPELFTQCAEKRMASHRKLIIRLREEML